MSRELIFRQAFYKNDVFLGWHEWGYKSEGIFESPATWNGSTSFVNEQYTGLKDNLGKRIFEGDILKNETEYVAEVIDGFQRKEPLTLILRVYYDAEYNCWFLKDVYEGEEFPIYELDGVYSVIGNIHENDNFISEV